MGDDNAVARAKREATPWWDSVAQHHIKRGNYLRAFGAWTMKQLSKAAPESWGGLALDVGSLGSGAAVSGLIRGARAARFAVLGERMIQGGLEAGEIAAHGAGKARVITRMGSAAPGLISPKPTGIAFKLAERGLMPNVDKLPRIVERGAEAWANPRSVLGFGRRAAKLGSLINRGISAERNIRARGGIAGLVSPYAAAGRGASRLGVKKPMTVSRISRPALGLGSQAFKLSLPKLGQSLTPHRPSFQIPKLRWNTALGPRPTAKPPAARLLSTDPAKPMRLQPPRLGQSLGAGLGNIRVQKPAFRGFRGR